MSAGIGVQLARYYDLDLADHTDDIDLYLALGGRRRQSILEMGCGTGRLAIPLARAGHDVVGIDHDPDMLGRARDLWAKEPGPGQLSLVEADATSLELGRRFDLVIVGLNFLPALAGRDAQAAALAAVCRHLQTGTGRAVIDVTLPSAAELASWDGAVSLAWQRSDPETADQVAKTWSVDYDNATQVAVVTSYFDSWPATGGPVRRVSRRDELHLISANELAALVHAAGMEPRQDAGDYNMTPFAAGSERVVLVCSLL